MEMDDIISPSKPETVATTMVDTQKDLNQPRMRMSEKIQQDITRENIELRMNTDNSENFNSFNDTVSSQPQTQRPYSIDPYTPPGYMQDTSVSEKNAYMDNGFRTGNQLKAAQQDQVWEASRGDGLKETLVQWAKKSNINLVWSAKRDYALSSNVWVNGDFRDALTAVVNDGLPTNNKPQIKLVDTPSDSKSTTFVVSDRG